MPVRDCTVLAVEGTQAAGKTTLVHALTAYYRERGIHAACTEEAARVSPYIDEIVLHNAGNFDLTAELDLYAAQLSAQLRAARSYALLITDKTVMNVTAYAKRSSIPAMPARPQSSARSMRSVPPGRQAPTTR